MLLLTPEIRLICLHSICSTLGRNCSDWSTSLCILLSTCTVRSGRQICSKTLTSACVPELDYVEDLAEALLRRSSCLTLQHNSPTHNTIRQVRNTPVVMPQTDLMVDWQWHMSNSSVPALESSDKAAPFRCIPRLLASAIHRSLRMAAASGDYTFPTYESLPKAIRLYAQLWDYDPLSCPSDEHPYRHLFRFLHPAYNRSREKLVFAEILLTSWIRSRSP